MEETARENLLSPRPAELLAIMTVVSKENHLTLIEVQGYNVFCFSQLHMECMDRMDELLSYMRRRLTTQVEICQGGRTKWRKLRWRFC